MGQHENANVLETLENEPRLKSLASEMFSDYTGFLWRLGAPTSEDREKTDELEFTWGAMQKKLSFKHDTP